MRKAFSFYRSHYEQFKILNKSQIADITLALCEVQFLEKHIDDISFTDKITNLVWVGIKHGIESSVKGYVSKKGGIATPLARGSKNVSTPLEQGEEEEKEEEKEKEQYVEGLNLEAFKMWIAYKGKSYTKQGKTLSMNKLAKFDTVTQQEMVDNSIMFGYKGLFELKAKNTFIGKQPEVGSLEWERQQKLQQGEIIDGQII